MAVVIVVVDRGNKLTPQPIIAGGYDTQGLNPCIGPVPPPPAGLPLPPTAPGQPKAAGPSFNIVQSGEFVNINNAAGTLSGKLRLQEKTLANGGHQILGNVNCVTGHTVPLNAVAVAGTKATITGTLAGAPFSSTLKTNPPDPGSPAPRIPNDLAGLYALSPRSTCFGGGSFALASAGSDGYKLTVGSASVPLGKLTYSKATGSLEGDVACVKGGSARLTATANDINLNNITVIPLQVATPVPTPPSTAAVVKTPAGTAVATVTPKPALTTPTGLSPSGEKFTGVKQRSDFNHLVAAFLIAIAIVMVVARLFGIVAVKVGQPRVMGEVIAGILLGPSLFGWLAPNAQSWLFGTDILNTFGIVANLGLIFYMFLVGMEVDTKQLKGRVTQAAMISNASIALPMMLGLAVAVPLYKILGPDKKFVAFALFMGVSMSITAFPVLARILTERRMLKRPVGALTIGCAAIDDVTAWFLIALATTVAVSGTFGDVAKTIGEAVAYVLIMVFAVRPLVGRLSTAFDEVGRVPGGWVVAIFAGVMLSAYITQEINIAVIFGGFIMGMIMPRNERLTEEITRRIEDFVIILLLPMFFVYTGLRTDVGLLNTGTLWLVTIALIAIAIIGKMAGGAIAARYSGFDWRSSAVIGTLMNTRGLTELIVLNLALSAGAISSALFAALVIMALVTTLMAGPMLKLLDPKNEYGSAIEDEFAAAKELTAHQHPEVHVPDRSILVAPQTNTAVSQLVALAQPLASSQPPRELILARLVQPPRGASVRGGLQTENLLLKEAFERVTSERERLIGEGTATRAVALTSANPGSDLARLTEREPIDLVLVEGRRRLIGEGVPLGEVSTLLESAPCDVAVLVANESEPLNLGPDTPILVPFGGAEHDWSALELGSWLAASTGAPLKLLGAAGQTDEGGSVTRTLADAGLVAQQATGVAAEPLVVQGGRDGIIAAATGAGLLVIGLSDRWRKEGLGPTRSEIAKAAPSPVLFVRRGSRPGIFAPREDATRFRWSMADDMGPAGRFSRAGGPGSVLAGVGGPPPGNGSATPAADPAVDGASGSDGTPA